MEEDDPFAALDALVTRVRAGDVDDEDPFAMLDSFSTTSASSSGALASLFSDLEQSCSSLATVLAGFFAEEYGVSLASDDVLADKGLGQSHLDALEAFLVTTVGLVVPSEQQLALLGEGVRFWALIAHTDKLARKQKLDVEAAVKVGLITNSSKFLNLLSKDVLVPIEVPADYQRVTVEEGKIIEPPSYATIALQRAAEDAGCATPKTRRRNAVEKGIAKFASYTLRGRTPQAQSEKQKAVAQRPTVRANVILPPK